MKERIFPSALWSKDPDTDYEEDVVLGQLSFNGENYLQLDIPSGVLLDYPLIPTDNGYMQCHTTDGLHADFVYGFSQTGDYYLLQDVTSPGTCFAAPGFDKQTLTGASLFITRQKIRKNPTIKSISIKIPGLREWIGTVPFSVTHTFGTENNKLEEIAFNCNIGKCANIILYKNEELEFYVSFTFTQKGGSIPAYEFCFESDCELNIKYKQPSLSFNEALNQHVFPLAGFLWYCLGFRQAIASIKFATADNILGEYIAPLVGASGQPTNTQLNNIPLTYKRIKPKTNEMIARWLEFDEYARNSSTLVTSLMNNWKMPIDMRFLASAQAFEAASRSKVNEQEISDENLKSKIEAIKSSDMGKDLKRWVVYKIKNAKWKSANSLAKDLIQKMGDYAPFIIPNIPQYLEDHRQHRDAYTHRRDIEESRRLSNDDLFIHTEATQLLTYGSIALFLGIEPNELIDAFKKSNYRWSIIHRANRLYSLDASSNSNENEND